ncbi:hypothetical protein [Psychromicrobium xiongbiense]|uniref:hypothetical protein n=1 Tax=Psychromicrobium xiongbiense TaxID=3051184 RepID=UPI002556E0DF|nr:hypothetical protein [Psychromicrobium sp. YIM S02556]
MSNQSHPRLQSRPIARSGREIDGDETVLPSTYGPDPTFDPVDSRFNEAVNAVIDARLLAMFEEQVAAEFQTASPLSG